MCGLFQRSRIRVRPTQLVCGAGWSDKAYAGPNWSQMSLIYSFLPSILSLYFWFGTETDYFKNPRFFLILDLINLVQFWPQLCPPLLICRLEVIFVRTTSEVVVYDAMGQRLMT